MGSLADSASPSRCPSKIQLSDEETLLALPQEASQDDALHAPTEFSTRGSHNWPRKIIAAMIVTIAIAAGCVVGSHRAHLVGTAGLPWLQEEYQVHNVISCFVDGAGGLLIKEKFKGKGLMCLRLKTRGKTLHGHTTAKSCSALKSAMRSNSSDVQEVVCCRRNLCNGDNQKLITCYHDHDDGMLTSFTSEKYTGSAREQVCAKYTYLGLVSHVTAVKSTCENMKALAHTFKDVTCCSENYCNGPSASAAEDKEYLACYTDGIDGGLTATIYPNPHHTLLCAKYTMSGTTYHTMVTKSTGHIIKADNNAVLCHTDRCNGD